MSKRASNEAHASRVSAANIDVAAHSNSAAINDAAAPAAAPTAAAAESAAAAAESAAAAAEAEETAQASLRAQLLHQYNRRTRRLTTTKTFLFQNWLLRTLRRLLVNVPETILSSFVMEQGCLRADAIRIAAL